MRSLGLKIAIQAGIEPTTPRHAKAVMPLQTRLRPLSQTGDTDIWSDVSYYDIVIT